MMRWKKVCPLLLKYFDAILLCIHMHCVIFYDAAYRFQLAGYRDEHEYLSVNKGTEVCKLNRIIFKD